ncbi:hypothetical protein CVIRNUC_008820 [Coccomyxa viridis]|uniref:Cytochrome P450 n=1 Tax=Coccomyxa viridis TaxID=1274662 RepID=A0AAV1IE30_9CHLO|nr:hypothetical protein CVIRNUC_008820 [Coccomyxa viridis]
MILQSGKGIQTQQAPLRGPGVILGQESLLTPSHRRAPFRPCRQDRQQRRQRGLPVCASSSNGNGSGPSYSRNGNLSNGNKSGSSVSNKSLDERILSGEFTDQGSTKERITRPIRKALAKDPVGPGRNIALRLAKAGKGWKAAAAVRMPEARGDIREIIGQPVFVPLQKLAMIYGKVFRLSFGPKSFVVVSDAEVARYMLMTNAGNYTKGVLSEILDFVMGKGLIPADGDVWKARRRAIVPSLHRKYIENMVGMFADSALHGVSSLQQAHQAGKSVEMENFFSRLTLDIIGKAVFNYDFDSLTHDDPVIQAVYTVLREAEYRSTYPLPYWNLPLMRLIVPRQRRCQAALATINRTLSGLIAKSKRVFDEEDQEFGEDFLSEEDPSILHFLLAGGDEITSKQLRDDLMTMLIAGHETTAAVLTWTLHCLTDRPDVLKRLQHEIDTVLGDRKPTLDDLKKLRLTTRVINEAMRLYPQPPVLIRRATEDDVLGGFSVAAGSDIFISVWNIHRNAGFWSNADSFDPDRFPVEGPIPNEITENFNYLPFGGGRRKCIGDQFALFEAVVGLAVLLRRFDFQMAPGAPAVGMTTGATIHTSDGLVMELMPRVHNELNGTPILEELAMPASAPVA